MASLLSYTITVILITITAGAEEKRSCITSCQGMTDGYYPSCSGGHSFAECQNGTLFDNRPCPENAVWDDTVKQCKLTSTTSDTLPCVRSCQGIDDGDYQSCYGCNKYALCLGGVIYDKRPCPMPLVWDDSVKRCQSHSSTCTMRPCVASCQGVTDGTYASCDGCNMYSHCVNGVLYNKNCPINLFWSDVLKTCDFLPSTCPMIPCVRYCQGVPDGDYQSCSGCYNYVHCEKGQLFEHKCATPTLWDDLHKTCVWVSKTCTMHPCQTNCQGVADGNYPSCKACNMFVYCTGGSFYDLLCSTGSFWDDSVKRCEKISTTCPVRP